MQHFKKGDIVPNHLLEVSEDFRAEFGCDVYVIGDRIDCESPGPVFKIKAKDAPAYISENTVINIKADYVQRLVNGGTHSIISFNISGNAHGK